jgi:DNA-binding HxlR family transcriptional regulator
LDVLGERWSLLIVRDMIVGATRFNELARGLPGLSRSLLAKRLRQLERAGVVERVDQQYLLTDAGRGLEPIIFGLGRWGAQWTFGEPTTNSTPSCWCGGCTQSWTRQCCRTGGTCSTSASPTTSGNSG